MVEDGGLMVERVLSNVEQADDVSLLATSLDQLKCILDLTKEYCDKYNVKLVPFKSKLLVYHDPRIFHEILTELLTKPIEIDGNIVSPCDEAVHVGIVRSTAGNSAHISSRMTAHRKAIYSLLHTGLGRSHGSM